ncbi:MAG: DUF2867 domain-containing protein [Prevotellaceae bacterium]|jgi:hypothetical protein|nr:DUF2867 domain-containing protein [Prevotellaceae bacterium]
MKVSKSKEAKGSLISKYIPADYTGAYRCDFISSKEIIPDDIQLAFWLSDSKLVKGLFKLRNILVKPFGLQADSSSNNGKLERILRGEESGEFMKVSDKSENETILCLNDKHLKACISAYLEKTSVDNYTLTVTTVVEFHKMLGQVYFFLIYPFHHLVVKHSIKRAVRSFEDENKNA